MELTIEQALQQGVEAHKEGKLQEAERLYRTILQSHPVHPDANHNLGLIAISVNQAAAALPFLKIALEENPKIEQFWFSYIDALIRDNQIKNAQKTLKKTKRKGFSGERINTLTAQLEIQRQAKGHVGQSQEPSKTDIDALLSSYQSGQNNIARNLALSMTQNFPGHQLSWKILGAVLSQFEQIDDALIATKNAIRISPQDPETHNNLGVMLHDLGRLEEAEKSCKQAIVLNPEFAEAHFNLGNTLQNLDRLKEAESNLIKAIALKPNYAEAYRNLGIIFYVNGNINAALDSFEKANDIAPKLKTNTALLAILQARKARKKIKVSADDVSEPDRGIGLTSNPLILKRAVETDLITRLYKMASSELYDAPGPRYGNGRCSPDYNLFEYDSSIIKTVANDLISTIQVAVNSKVFIMDSFFNIYGAGGGSTPHAHLSGMDNYKRLNLGKQKYSLVYYLAVGDQDCRDPGILKLYDPREDILPCEGMIAIFPADRKHSAVYGGGKDRVMIGVNFYSL